MVVGAWLDEVGVDIDWLPVPECYRVLLPKEGVNQILHDGFEQMARDVDAVCPGTY